MDINIEKIIDAAKAGGKVVEKHFGKEIEITEKSMASDVRTLADTESEKAILKSLEVNFPGCNVYSEENGEDDRKSDYTFIVDPMDGTNNFVLGIPMFTISIALLLGDDLIAGVVYNPMLDIVYFAKRGMGAYADGKKMSVSSEKISGRSTVALVGAYNQQKNFYHRIFRNVDLCFKRVLLDWSPAHDFCLLASGKIEALFNNGTEVYDYAAGRLIAEEAGAIITDFRGRNCEIAERHFLVSCNSNIHDKILPLLIK